jgi:hypothetical protein
MSIITKVMSSNPVHGEVYSIQNCDRVCQLFATGRWFSLVSSINKTDHQDITGILLKVALNTMDQTYI